jgi:hypothetical protein
MSGQQIQFWDANLQTGSWCAYYDDPDEHQYNWQILIDYIFEPGTGKPGVVSWPTVMTFQEVSHVSGANHPISPDDPYPNVGCDRVTEWINDVAATRGKSATYACLTVGDYSGGAVIVYDTAIFSAPLHDNVDCYKHHPTPSDPCTLITGPHRNPAKIAVLTNGVVNLWVASVHTEPHDYGCPTQSANHVLAKMGEEFNAGYPASLIILAGDFNSENVDPSNVSEQSFYAPDGSTWTRDGERIDYVFLDGGSMAGGSGVLILRHQNPVYGECGSLFSDHRALGGIIDF